ncbi:DUF58 domain-containing protein [Myxococcota bacterium]|nr:DUF58 domain-containing protein [Myxococcota bacterium]MBU1430676.1 DUF58 domain-containing protein [Myxococcota bacterium]MBU1898258.1 DUF58 domain-containing protein [Myxococcota bacterium]
MTASGRALLGLALALTLAALALTRAELAGLASLSLGLLMADRLSALGRRRAAAEVTLEVEAPHGLIRRQPYPLILRARNPGAALGAARLSLEISAEVEGAIRQDLWIPARAEAEVSFALSFPRAGRPWLHGARLTALGPLGLFGATRIIPLRQPLVISPRPVAPRAASNRGGDPRAARHRLQRAGEGMEIRELRGYVPGDPLKTMAWRATARRGQPIVRVFEAERHRHIQLLIYMGPEARRGVLGQTPLDEALDHAARLIETLKGDRLGLTIFDERVYSHRSPGVGASHRQALLEQLRAANHVVDEDLTEIDDASLLALVGDYLTRYEGLDARGAAGWRAHLTLVDPIGELFDAGQVHAAVRRRLVSARAQGMRRLEDHRRPAEDLHSARLRLFCALWGLALPYRLMPPPDALDRGLAAAIKESLSPHQAQALLILSDLHALPPRGAATRAIALARQRYKKTVRFLNHSPPTPPHSGAPWA